MRIASYVDVVPDLRAMAEKGGMMGSIFGRTSEALREAARDAAVCGQMTIALVNTMKNEGKLRACARHTWRDGLALSSFLCWLENFVVDGKTV